MAATQLPEGVIQVSDASSPHGPFYRNVPVHCICGNKFTIDTTFPDLIHVESCHACNPLHNKGKQVVVVSKGRMDHFQKKMERIQAKGS